VDTVTLTPSRLVAGGEALARDDDGRVVFVSGALPGETVRVALRTVKKDFAKGDVVDVVEASPDRVVAPCDAFHRGCGGCDWQHIDPRAQLRMKVSIVTEALTRIGRLDAPVVVAGGAVEPWGYRTAIRVSADRNGAVGFRSRRSHDIVAIDHCPVAHPRVNALLGGVRLAWGSDASLRASLTTGESTSTVDGADGVIHETVRGERLRVSARSFFQSSPQAAEMLVDAVERGLASVDLSDATLVDAYGGVGLFAATVGRQAGRVVLIELSPASCADARVNLVGRAATIHESAVESWTPVAADVVIADPARSGLDRDAAAVLAATGAPVLVLVSCDAAALGRDARILAEFDYEHDGTEVIDVFPHTSHIEAVTRFRLNLSRAGMGTR
jgi:23S rRNA (uracil1939-C5)-methyltransferase